VLAAWLWCDPQWTLTAAFGLEAAIVVCGATMSAGFPFLTYVAVPELTLIAALVAMLRPRLGASWSVPTTVLAVCCPTTRPAHCGLACARPLRPPPLTRRPASGPSDQI
jgi:hypothetical protein